MTLGLGRGKVIQYNSPDLYLFCPQYLILSTNDFDAV